MATELDYMEYSSDALAQAAYVTNGTYSVDILTGGTITADSTYAGYPPENAVDNNGTTLWASGSGVAFPHWIKYDFGAGNTPVVQRVTIRGDSGRLKNFEIRGSNDDSNWTSLYTGVHANDTSVQTFSFSNSTGYRYYMIYGTTGWGAEVYMQVNEWECMTLPLQSFSESTIKSQGSYSLKGIATTDANGKTLTRTIDSPIDLSGVDTLKFDIYSSRTGGNIKIGIHDSGGTTSEKTHSITDANTWETAVWDISAVDDADKDAIDSIIITIANADSANTFYVDCFVTAENVTITAEPFIVTSTLSSDGAVVIDGYGFIYEEDSSGAGMDVSLRTGQGVGKNLYHRKCIKYIYHRINTHGKDVTMTVYIDGVAQSPTFTINTTTLVTRRIEDVPAWEGYKFDIGLSCEDVTDTDLEIHKPLAVQYTQVGD